MLNDQDLRGLSSGPRYPHNTEDKCERGRIGWQRIRKWVLKLLLSVGAIIFISSILIFYFAALKKSKKQQVDFWNPSMIRALKSLFVCVLAGGIFSVMLIDQGYVGMVAPSTLIFYGLGLINASKYTYGEIEVLGYVELILGLVASFFMGFGLLFWVIGFGVSHVVFGLVLHFKYDKK